MLEIRPKPTPAVMRLRELATRLLGLLFVSFLPLVLAGLATELGFRPRVLARLGCDFLTTSKAIIGASTRRASTAVLAHEFPGSEGRRLLLRHQFGNRADLVPAQ